MRADTLGMDTPNHTGLYRSRIAEADAIEEQQLKWIQLGSSGWSWPNQGTTAEVDTNRSSSWSRQNRAATCGWQSWSSNSVQRAARHAPDCSCSKWSYLDQKSQVQMLHVHVPWICSEASLVPRPTPIWFALAIIQWCGRVAHGNREDLVLYPSCDWCQVDMWGPTTNEFTTGWRTCVDRLGVLTSCVAFEPSRLDDELLEDLLKWLWARPPYVLLTSTWWHSCDERYQAFPVLRCSSASAYYCQCKPMNRKRGRLGNKATLRHRR